VPMTSGIKRRRKSVLARAGKFRALASPVA
jgi:hypothetical protein